MRGGLRFAIAALFVTTAACANGRGTTADPAQLRPRAAPVRVNVTNNSQSAMEIFVLGNGTSFHMGTVAPGVPRSFDVPLGMVAADGHVQFLAQASGAGPRVQTDEVKVVPGDVVDFEITTNLVGSRATVRP